jgi:hypothetical protein
MNTITSKLKRVLAQAITRLAGVPETRPSS